MKASLIFDPQNVNSLNQNFRTKRFSFFKELLQKNDSDNLIEILDIGGEQSYWEKMNFTESNKFNITLLNLEVQPVKYNNFSSIKGDASNLSIFRDKQFDIVFSNSVIEHLYSIEKQKMMASEVRRVGKWYYIQTPNFFFPMEPHWLFPFFQFLPFIVKVYLTKNFNLGHYKKSKSKAAAIQRVNEVKLLTENEMKMLFPDGKVQREYFFGFIKSFTMYYFPEI
jgi:hypothetical protein